MEKPFLSKDEPFDKKHGSREQVRSRTAPSAAAREKCRALTTIETLPSLIVAVIIYRRRRSYSFLRFFCCHCCRCCCCCFINKYKWHAVISADRSREKKYSIICLSYFVNLTVGCAFINTLFCTHHSGR